MTGPEIGDSFALDDGTPENPVRVPARLSGEGSAQIGVVPAGRAIQVPDRSVIPAPDSWDF